MDAIGTGYEEAIGGITSKLTGEWEHDREYLLAQMQLYKNHPLAKEIIRECGRLLYEVTPAEIRRELDELISEHHDETNDTLTEVVGLIKAGDHARALEMAESLAQKMDALVESGWDADDSESRYFDFRSDIDLCVWRAHNAGEHRTIRQATEPFARVYATYASCLYEAGHYEDAMDACATAIRWNPADADLRFELGENHKRLGDMDGYERVMKELYPYVASAADLARYHRGMGYLRMEQSKLRLSAAHLLVSLLFEKSSLPIDELYYMKVEFGQDFSGMGREEAFGVLKAAGDAVYLDADTHFALERLLKVSRMKNDDRTALVVAVELFNIMKEDRYRQIARSLMKKLGIREG